ncbi:MULTISPECIES: hypothetical protein [unclassified Streptomyces]|uniref:hypothetical protein n=1 Tax=unclassified Streptomyces TaxID=2593676 RepID=UPI001F04E242|nr:MULTISPECIES: hypothetical protein [unclassified Streptomyces]MCH0562868.1 hypothetical protein [Streptomyces sp. MUM 2J]MCH0572781.1 hypothetical protein [Streptomyces sp. MUM 136J]
MTSFLVPLAAAALIVAAGTAVLVRRDRRYMAASPKTLRAEAAAARGVPVPRRRGRSRRYRPWRARR